MSTRTAAATEARRSAGFVRRAVKVADEIEQLPDVMLRELILVALEEVDRRDEIRHGVTDLETESKGHPDA